MPNVYTYATLATAQQQLADRLYDPTFQRWSQAELTLYIQEALREFNSLASFWHDDFSFTPDHTTPYYNLSDAGQMPNTLRPQSLTDYDIYPIAAYHLLEPPPAIISSVLTWQGSLQFSLDDFIQATQRRRDEILGIAHCRVIRTLWPAIPGRTFLTDRVTDLIRVALIPQTGFGSAYPLWPSDLWGLQSYDSNFAIADAGLPSTYRTSTEPPVSFDVSPPLGVPGRYEVLTVETGVPTFTSAGPNPLELPNDWAWVLKWGMLADLLNRESNAKDSLRAEYCNTRYRQGLELLTNASSLLAMRINSIPIQIDGIRAADEYNTSWQARTPAIPDSAYMAGLDQFYLSPQPDVDTYSATCTVVQNAPIPSAPTDKLQVGRDLYDIILDECVHLAAFKDGGEEFTATFPLHDRFMREAALYNSKLAQMGSYQKALWGLANRQEELAPRYATEANPGGGE